MAKRVFIIHGWDGYPEEGWFPWLKAKLEKSGFIVAVPAMPNPSEPVIAEWVGHLANIVGTADEHTYFVGHSIGCQTILRYVETLNAPVGGVVCVAGFFELADLGTEDERRIAKPWVKTSIDFEKVRRISPRITVIFSDDDPDVPLVSNRNTFERHLGARVVVESGKGHFTESDGVTELPSALQAVLDMNLGG